MSPISVKFTRGGRFVLCTRAHKRLHAARRAFNEKTQLCLQRAPRKKVSQCVASRKSKVRPRFSLRVLTHSTKDLAVVVNMRWDRACREVIARKQAVALLF